MIRTLTLNPAVDRTVTIERFRVDAVNRITDSRLDPGGKGINVSKAVHGLGGQSIAYGFLGGAAGGFIRSYLEGRGIPQRFIELEGETRTNLKVVDPLQSTHTDINESGPLAAAGAVARLEAQLFSDTGPGDVLVFSGSLCPGVDAGAYARWIQRCRAIGAYSVLDADGEALRLGVAAGPSIVKPNVDELERLVGKPLSTKGIIDVPAVVEAARGLVARGCSMVVVSLGADGALFTNGTAVIRAFGIPIKALSTVGAGDSVVASLCLSLQRGDSMEQLVRPAIAAGTAAAATAGSQSFDPSTLSAYEARVHYEIIEGKPA